MAGSINTVDQTRTGVKAALFAALPQRLLLDRGCHRQRNFALTFDDGPLPEFTAATLDVLRKYKVVATFFLLGSQAELYPELVRSIVADGHEIGSHAYSHASFDQLSFRDAALEVSKTKDLLEQLTGQRCRLFRPPYGKLALQSLVPAWVKKQSVVLWSVDLKDYQARSATEIREQLMANPIRDGDIVLYHAKSAPAVDALPQVLESAMVKERRARTVSQISRLSF